jgi:BirA family transcriptional regulator, biotin operon repressor / biotin---[acetyl-CoA-carboxylase] ligase
MPDAETDSLGHPRVHLRRTDSTNERARRLAIAGAPHGTVVTAEEQSAGRGRQGRSWLAPPHSALLCSFVLRDPNPLLSLIAGVAVCDVVGDAARVKWPNDVVVERRGMDSGAHTGDRTPGREQAEKADRLILAKLAGILVEGRPQEGWAVLGIGLNVAVRVEQLPAELHGHTASLGLDAGAIEPIFERLLDALVTRLAEPIDTTLKALRARDALYGRDVVWGGHDPQSQSEHGSNKGERGRAQGIDDKGQLLVRREDGGMTALSAGEVHLESVG